ncbi:hypothetical protein NEUTE2DRAFT_61598 [Neurospora tetrasperma FGSC 2509]|nr:hypothetical protein NEUTE2DRAFT_61598 [Neurospora tetrasperma FGSC 2509]
MNTAGKPQVQELSYHGQSPWEAKSGIVNTDNFEPKAIDILIRYIYIGICNIPSLLASDVPSGCAEGFVSSMLTDPVEKA